MRCPIEVDRLDGGHASVPSRKMSGSMMPVDLTHDSVPAKLNRVAVCIPTYNGEWFVGDALRSVLGQSYADARVIVSDDCSTDRTQAIVEATKDPRVDLHVNSRRLGLVGNWNRCIELASAEFIQIFHQDDVMSSDSISHLVQALDRHPEAGFAFSNMRTIDETGGVIGGHWYPDLPEDDMLYPGEEFFRLLVRQGNVVPCQSVMVRSSCLKEAGPYDSRLRYTPDLEMWLRLSLHYDVAYVAEPLVLVRRHPGQESSSFLGSVKEVDEVWRAFQIVFRENAGSLTEADMLYRRALNHLQRWSGAFLRNNLREGHLRSAMAFQMRLLQFWRAEKLGLAGLPSLPEPCVNDSSLHHVSGAMRTWD